MGDSIDRDVITDVLTDEISDLTGWLVTALTIDWDNSTVTTLSN